MSNIIRTPYPPIPGRPLFVEFEKGKVWILFHDHYHLRTRRKMVKKIYSVHPDTCRREMLVSPNHIEKLIRNFHAWQEKEHQWYASFRLYPPSRKIEFPIPGKPAPLPKLSHRFPRLHWTRRLYGKNGRVLDFRPRDL